MYDTEMIYGITVHIEEGMDKYHDTWREVLTRDIERVIDALPGPALEIVKDTRIYLHKKYIYPGKDDSDGAAVSTSKLYRFFANFHEILYIFIWLHNLLKVFYLFVVFRKFWIFTNSKFLPNFFFRRIF